MEVFLKFVHLASIIIWLGSIVFFSFFAAPSIFKVLPRETAGTVVGDIFPKYWMVGYACGLAALASLFALSALRGRYPVARLSVLAVMTVLVFYSGLVVGKKGRSLKAEMRRAPDERKKELRKRFRKTHAVSSVLNMTTLALGVALVLLTAFEMNL